MSVRPRNTTKWPVAQPRVRETRRLPCLREDDGYHPRCEGCGWYGVDGIPDLNGAVFLYDLHRHLAHGGPVPS